MRHRVYLRGGSSIPALGRANSNIFSMFPDSVDFLIFWVGISVRMFWHWHLGDWGPLCSSCHVEEHGSFPTVTDWRPQGASDANIDLRALRDLAMSMRLIAAAERPVEALHAQTKREVQRVPHHASALVSLSHRLMYLHEQMESRYTLEKFAVLLASLPDARAVLHALGLQNHPSAGALHDPRGSRAFEILYRADGYSKYRMPAPKITLVQHTLQSQSAILLSSQEGELHSIKREAVISHITKSLKADGTC